MAGLSIVKPGPERAAIPGGSCPSRGLLAASALRFALDERGSNALQYALVAVLVALVLVGAISSVGTSISNLYQKQANAVGTL